MRGSLTTANLQPVPKPRSLIKAWEAVERTEYDHEEEDSLEESSVVEVRWPD